MIDLSCSVSKTPPEKKKKKKKEKKKKSVNAIEPTNELFALQRR
jgi:hypothetical protein